MNKYITMLLGMVLSTGVSAGDAPVVSPVVAAAVPSADSSLPAPVAEALTPEKQAAIEQFMTMAGSNKMGNHFAGLFVQQITQAIKAANPSIPEQAQSIIREEVHAAIEAKMQGGDSLQTALYPVYNQYLTLEEIKILIAFYQTPVGKKITAVMPKLTQETMLAGQKWAQALAPEIKARISSRFLKEGIELK